MGIFVFWVIVQLSLFSLSECQKITRLEQFVDEIPQIPLVYAYLMQGTNNVKPTNITIGMHQVKCVKRIYELFCHWVMSRLHMFMMQKFHRDLPATTVFAYGTSSDSASIPGPTIEARNGVPVHVEWQNFLPKTHILPLDTAIPAESGVPTVPHLHGGMTEPESDGHVHSWFTARFRECGPTWKKRVYRCENVQGPGNLWYHDHAVGLTRVNILAGLSGAYIVRDPAIEGPLNLPSGPELDRVLIISDRQFTANGSMYMTSMGNNPDIHPGWQPEYFGPVILVNGKAWPYLRVQRRRYRFRIINSSNARFYQLQLSGRPRSRFPFMQLGSDAFYLPAPVQTTSILLAPSEIYDVVVDFSSANWRGEEVILTNSAPYPYPSGDPVDEYNSQVLKFVVEPYHLLGEVDISSVPKQLVPIQRLRREDATVVRHVNLYEFQSAIGEPTHLYINAVPMSAPATETPRPGTTELWQVINLTEDNHPLHLHLTAFQVIDEQNIKADELRECLLANGLTGNCSLPNFLDGGHSQPIASEAGWKNVYKMKPSVATTLLVRFTTVNGTAYPFDATAEPGYVYHCHIEENEVIRPLKLVN